MSEANFDSAVALQNRMAPDLREIPHIVLIREYHAAQGEARAALLREIRAGRRPAAVAAAAIAARINDLEAARTLIEAAPSRSNDELASRAAWFAQLEMSYGRSSAAERYIAEVDRLNTSSGRVLRLGHALLPFVTITDAEMRALRTEFEKADFSVPPGTGDHDPLIVRPIARLYYIGALSARLGDTQHAREYVAQIEAAAIPQTWQSFARAHAGSLRARIALAEGRPDEALRLLERNELIAMDIGAPALNIDRYIRIELLLKAGRAAEALQWIDHAFEQMGGVFISPPFLYHAVRELLRGEANEQLGEREKAIAAYSRFLELWRDADSEFEGMIRHARERRDALVARRG